VVRLAGLATVPLMRGQEALERLPFAKLLAAVVAVGVVVGIGAYILAGATTNRGTTGAIGSENATIMAAEKASCTKFGKYATIARLRSEGLLAFAPTYNSVVYVPGSGCGTIVVGSPAYQSQAG
jgi:hypothetical protein